MAEKTYGDRMLGEIASTLSSIESSVGNIDFEQELHRKKVE